MLWAAVPGTQPFTEGWEQGAQSFKLAIVLLQELGSHSLSCPAWHGGMENASSVASAAELSI